MSVHISTSTAEAVHVAAYSAHAAAHAPPTSFVGDSTQLRLVDMQSQ